MSSFPSSLLNIPSTVTVDTNTICTLINKVFGGDTNQLNISVSNKIPCFYTIFVRVINISSSSQKTMHISINN